MAAIICVAAACLLLVLDLTVKQHIENHMGDREEREILNGKVLLRKVHNEGLMLNALDQHPKAVKLLNGAAGVILLLYYIWLLMRKGHFVKKAGAALMTGGAFSNLYDHMVRGYVVDYFGFKTKWKKVTDVTFNLADIFIFAGGIIIILTSIFTKKK